jgi:arginase family enzyme
LSSARELLASGVGARAKGTSPEAAEIPATQLGSFSQQSCVDYYVTINSDGFDPSIAPGTGTPSHGGFVYYEVLELLDGLTTRGRIVGIDLVEVAPDYDHTGTTSILAAQILLNLIGRIFIRRQGCPTVTRIP